MLEKPGVSSCDMNRMYSFVSFFFSETRRTILSLHLELLFAVEGAHVNHDV